MERLRRHPLTRFAALGLASVHLALVSGCATIIRTQNETVTLKTDPPGRSVSLNGKRFSDGDRITIKKNSRPPELNTGSAEKPVMVKLKHKPDVLLAADALLLLVFIVPGVVALGVDLGTGAWRDLEDPQIVPVSEPAPRAVPASETSPAKSSGSGESSSKRSSPSGKSSRGSKPASSSKKKESEPAPAEPEVAPIMP